MAGRTLRGSLGLCMFAVLASGCGGEDAPLDPAAAMEDPDPDPSERPGRFDYVVLDGTIYGRTIGADDGGLSERIPWLGLVPAFESVPVNNPDDDRGFDVGDFVYTFGGEDDLDPREYALAAAAGTAVRVDGGERIDGEKTTRYVGDVDADRLRAAPGLEADVRDLLLGRLKELGKAVRAEFWVDDSYRLRRFVLTSGDSTLTMQFRDLGRKLEIAAPPPEDLRPLSELGTESTDALLKARLERRYGAECGAELFGRYRRGEAPPRVDVLRPCS